MSDECRDAFEKCRDYIMEAQAAVDYGIVDRVISSRSLTPVPKP